MNRKELRPFIASAVVNSNMSVLEQFQNQTLRPILKLQHQHLVSLFKNYMEQSKTQYVRMELYQKNEYIQNTVAKNTALKNQFIGMVIGLFTLEEFNCYLKNKTDYNKRIIQMTIQRLQDCF